MTARPDDPTRTHHIAQLNIGILRAHRDDPMIAGFMAALDSINALADASPGFVGRLETPEGNATALRPFEEARERLAHLERDGPTPAAFTFRERFPAPMGSVDFDPDQTSCVMPDPIAYLEKVKAHRAGKVRRA